MLGNINWGKTARKNHLKKSFNFQSHITDNSSAADTMDIDLIIMKAQEQLCLAMEAQQCTNCLQHWAEQLVKVWVTEVSRVRASDKTVAERASEWAVGRIVGKRREEKAVERAVERVVWRRMAEKVAAEAVVKIWDRQVQVSIS